VAFNHKFNTEFQRFQEILAEQIAILIDQERSLISPRLVGSFVYDSDANFVRPELAVKSIVWCPQALTPENNSGSGDNGVKPYGDGANCMSDFGGLLKLGSVLNFLVPMGPFPTRESYESYLREYGDRGLAKNPQFEIKSVMTNANTIQDVTGLTTFFDGQRIDLKSNEGLRICYEKDTEGMLTNLKFSKVSGTSHSHSNSTAINSTIINSSDIQAVFNSADGAGTYILGLQWAYPFWGAVNFTSPLTGKILGQIPFRKDNKGKREVGDPQWQRTTWDFSPYFQRCQRFCDHPYFDESGTYQLETQWRSTSTLGCPNPKYPEVIL
jgi:hypothetical protein